MTRTLVVLAAVSGLAMSSALAQAPAPPENTPASPSATPAPAAPPAAATAKPGSAQVVNAQSKDEWLASKLKGTSVMGSDGQKVGSVSDILFDKSGQVKALVVGVGGVLGIGAKEIALDMKQFHEAPATSGGQEQLKIDMTKEQLTQAEEFKPLPNPPTTTGAAPGAARPSQRPASPP